MQIRANYFGTLDRPVFAFINGVLNLILISLFCSQSTSLIYHFKGLLAAMVGFEPTNTEVKVRSLAAWGRRYNKIVSNKFINKNGWSYETIKQ